MAGFSFDTSGFDEAINELDKLANKARSLDGLRVDFDDLFTSDFMSLHAHSLIIDDFFSSGNVIVDNEDDIESLSDNDAFNQYVSESTDFSSWDGMLEEAINCYVEAQLDS